MKIQFTLIKYLDKISSKVFKTKIPVSKTKVKSGALLDIDRSARKNIHQLLEQLNTSVSGLRNGEPARLISKYGLNEVIREKREFWALRFLRNFNNPLVILLMLLAIISLFTKDIPTIGIISSMILISVLIRSFEENQAYNAAESLRSLVRTTCTVIRNGKNREIDLKFAVPGDLVHLSAGDIVPADLRLINSKDLFINQSLLTGESLPVEKHVDLPLEKVDNPLELQNICFMGTNVESGTALGIVLKTGSNTYFGSLAKSIAGQRTLTSFDKGINKFTWLMIRFMLVMAPIVFLVNGFSKGNWLEAFLFAISVAVGLTPEMLPAVVTINLTKGAIAMSKKKVIVKRLSSIQNFGAMNVLCTDKTGTLTQNRIVLIKNVNIDGETDVNVLHNAYLNSFHQTGFKNILDEAVINHMKANELESVGNIYRKIDELPFDFVRRRLSVVVENGDRRRFLICKGAVEEVSSICKKYELHHGRYKLLDKDLQKIKNLNEQFSNDGFRVIAVAYKEIENKRLRYSVKEEKDMVFLGFMTFLDPPKETAASAILQLQKYGVDVKVLTGDNELVTRKICSEVGLFVDGVLLGNQIEKLSDEDLGKVVDQTTIFAKLSPDLKRRVIQALQNHKHVVGFLGDGVNDALGLRTADVGISVKEAVDISKESADIILLEMNLLVLVEGVLEGRRVFGNIIKYVKMGASSNFGNAFSVLGASLFLPFLPMIPLQLLTNNLLYDLSQTAIPTDNVDEEYLTRPRKWNIEDIRRFMLFIGPISSIFDYVTFGIMLFVFGALNNPRLFQTGWFVESLLTQTLIVHVIRSRKIPFIKTMSSRALALTTVLIMGVGIYLTFSPFAHLFNFVRLPLAYWPLLVIILISYVGLTQFVKTFYFKKFGYH